MKAISRAVVAAVSLATVLTLNGVTHATRADARRDASLSENSRAGNRDLLARFAAMRDAKTNKAEGVQVKYENWTDKKRQRTLPVKLYIPADLKAPAPVAIFSHGLGGSREAAPYLGNYWAQHGYLGVFIQHPGSDESFWKPGLDRSNLPNRQQLMGKFRKQLTNPQHAVDRAEDVHYVIDELERLNASDRTLKGKFNLGEIAIAGHSFGSWTALTASGQRFGPTGLSSEDPRIKAAIYLSPTPPKKGADPSQVFGAIKIPGLHLTGTLDDSPVNNTRAEDRRIAFDHISKSDQYLVILNDADHAVFGGRTRKELDNAQHKLIEQTTTAFLDAYLRNDRRAKDWLLNSATAYIKPHGTFELKTAKN